MASVYEKRGTWYANFKDATGRRRNVATKATTKTEARRLALDLERQAERARFGLEPLPSDSTLTLGDLCTWWLRERCPEGSVAIETQRLGKHVHRTALADLPLRMVTAAVLESRLREMERDGLGPSSTPRSRPTRSRCCWRTSPRSGGTCSPPRSTPGCARASCSACAARTWTSPLT